MFDFHTKLKHEFVVDLYIIEKIKVNKIFNYREELFCLLIKRFIDGLETKHMHLSIGQVSLFNIKGTIMSLKSPEQKSGHLVVPGERLGVIEEFIPDSGTYVKDGYIFQSCWACFA